MKAGYQQVKLNDLIDRPANAAYQEDGWDGWIAQAITARDETKAKWWCLIHHRNGKKANKTQVRGLQTMAYFDADVLTHPDLSHKFPSVRVQFVTSVRVAGNPTFGRFGVKMVGFRFTDVFGKIGTTSFPPSPLRDAMKRLAADLKPKRK